MQNSDNPTYDIQQVWSVDLMLMTEKKCSCWGKRIFKKSQLLYSTVLMMLQHPMSQLLHGFPQTVTWKFLRLNIYRIY